MAVLAPRVDFRVATVWRIDELVCGAMIKNGTWGGVMKSLTGLMVFGAAWMVVNAVVLRVLKRSLTFAEGVVCCLLLMLIISAVMSRI